METNISNLKSKLFYIASLVAIIGISIDAIFIESNRTVFILDVIAVLLSIIVIVLFYFKFLSDIWANGVIIYSVFLNALASIIVKIPSYNIEPNFFQSALLFGILILYSGFTLTRKHIYILGIIQILFYFIITLYTKSTVLLNFMPTTLILMVCYVVGVSFIISKLNDHNSNQLVYISNIHEVNQLLEEKGIELRRLNTTKDKLFSILGHDLRNPANTIMGFAELIAQKAETIDSKHIKEYADHIYQSSHSLNLLIAELLDWARLQSGNIHVNFQKVNINSLITDAIILMQGTIHLKSIKIDFADENEIEIIADKQMLATVLRNLLGNAIKYTPKQGNIAIQSKIEHNNFIFSIQDSGIGMEESKLSNLFTEVVAKSTPGTDFEKGTGLGLVICRGFINLHKGKIWAQSQLGKGSTFWFSIPIKT